VKTIELTRADRTMFAECPKCNKHELGHNVGNIYCMAYSKAQWARSPKCENCHTDMQLLYEVKTDDQ